MGDRTTPMKFGPEWLRNLSREPTSPGSSAQAGGPPPAPPARAFPIATSGGNASKVLLAKLRYGREEILALYDRQTAEAPPQLKSMERLYHPRSKPPYALNNNFEDDTRDSNMRNIPNLSMNPAERYGQGRGRGVIDGRGRATTRGRGFSRQTSLGSDTFRTPGWHNNGGQRTYPGAPDDDPVPPRGLWYNGNSVNPPGMRPGVTPEQAEWASKMAYRKNRQSHTNWRQQQNRDEEEWRSSEGARRGQEKWEREWPDRSNQEKPWASSSRRQWGGDNNEDALPEWAVENTEACGGTFDSSGAFHGYSNDDSNLPKTMESTYPLARSHTHGSFARSKTAEEGLDEWWASEKAKKLSTKRFDATDVKFRNKKSNEENCDGNAATNTDAQTGGGQTSDNATFESVRHRSTSSEDPTHDIGLDLQDEAAALPPKREEPKEDDKTKDRTYQNFSDVTPQSVQYRIDMLLRSAERDPNNERGNYKSVMMTSSNDHLRQKHQNIGAPTNDVLKRSAHYYDISKMPPRSFKESEDESQQKQQETKLVEDMLDMHLSEEIQAHLLNSTAQAAGMVHPVSSMANQMPSPGIQQMRMNTSLLNQGMGINQNNPNTAPSPGLQQQSMMRPIGITNSMLNASLGLPIDPISNIPINLSVPPPTIQNTNRMENLESMGTLASNIQSGMQSNLQVGGLPNTMQGPGMQGNSLHPGGGMTGNMQGNMQPVGINNSNLQSTAGMPGFQNVGNNSLFMQGVPITMHNPNNMSNHCQPHMYPMHGHNLQHSASQGSFSAGALYGNMMQAPPAVPLPNIPLTEQWYYEDPKKTIQGPFTSKEMYGWYRAGFFNPDLLVRRACESVLRPLANYGIMPFGPMDILPHQFNQMSGRFDMRPQTSLDNTMINAQQVGLGPEVESLWYQPYANDMIWMQQARTPRDDKNGVNNRPMFPWKQVRK